MARALYLELDPDPVFVVLHETETRPEVGVLFCSPFGWEDMASHRARRDWAEELAAAGCAVLRFDPPGSGDSGGLPSDPGRFPAWLDAIDAAARWLRITTGCERVVAVGFGLGGLLAVSAAQRGAAIDELVLWGARGTGRAHVRELRTFSRVEGTLDELPGGGLPVAGYVLSDETVAALTAVDIATASFTDVPPSRALLLERDGVAVDSHLRAALESAGVAVGVCPGPGYADVLLDWEQHPVSSEVRRTVARWIAKGRGPVDRPALGSPVEALDSIEPVPGVRERPIVIAGGLQAIVAEPVDAEPTELVVLLNAGLQRRIGPNRMWVEMARRWAARGVSTVRLDMAGLGDSDGDSGRYAATASLYAPELITEVRQALDDLAPLAPREEVVLGGLCAGAYWSLHSAIADERVGGALLLNPAVLVWDRYLPVAREARTIRRKLLHPRSWLRALTGRSDYRTHLQTLRDVAVLRSRPQASAGPDGRPADPDPVQASEVAPLLDRLTGKPVVMLFAGHHALHDELESEGILSELQRWPDVRVEYLEAEGDTHTIRPVALQRRVHEQADAALERLLSAERVA